MEKYLHKSIMQVKLFNFAEITKKSRINLHIWDFFCNFARFFEFHELTII